MTTATESIPARSSLIHILVTIVAKYGTLIVLGVMVVGLSIAAPTAFPTLNNITSILTQVALTAVIAGGLTLPLIVGEFDLSVGYQASLGGILVVGLVINQGLPIWLAFVGVAAVGALVGLFNGLVVTKLGVNALVATLGTGTILVGLNYAYSGGIPISGIGAEFTQIALGRVFGIPNTILIMIAVLAVLWVVLNRTTFGQHMQAVGGNAHASELSGVRVDRVKIMAFVIAGVCAMLTGALLASRVGSAQVTAGDSYLMTSFAAVFLGSAALRDGEFHIVGTFIGVLTVGVGFNGLAILGAPTFMQFLFSGVLLILAVAMSTVARKFTRGR
jgi:ribose transport system permease protein